MFRGKWNRKIKRVLAFYLAVLMLPLSDFADCFAVQASAAESSYEQIQEEEEVSASSMEEPVIESAEDFSPELAGEGAVASTEESFVESTEEISAAQTEEFAQATVFELVFTDEEYIVEEAGTLLCTLSGRPYYKTNNGLAVAAYAYLKTGYTAPVLISEDPDAVSYTTCGQIFTYSDTFLYLDRTWYVSSCGYCMYGNVNSTEGVLNKLSDSNESHVAYGKQLAESFVQNKEINVDSEEIVLLGSIDEEGNACLKWTTDLAGISEYRIYRDIKVIATVENDGSEISFCDTETKEGKTYCYSVYAVDSEGKGISVSNQVELATEDALVIGSDYILDEDKTVYSLTLNGGTLNLNGHTLTVQRDYIQNDGVLYFNGGVLYCRGNSTIANFYARVIMNNANDYMYVGKNLMLQNNGGSYYGEYTNGVMEVAGDFTATRADNFLPDGFHTVILSGNGRQNVTLGNFSYFQNLVCQNYSEDGICSEEGIVCRNCEMNENTSIYVRDQKTSIGFTLEEDTVFQEDYILGLGVLDLNGHTLTIEGNFYQIGGVVEVNGGKLEVKGDYKLALPIRLEDGTETYARSGGILRMTKPEDFVSVTGSFFTASAADHNRCFTEGTLEVKGDFRVMNTYSESSFVATGNHKVVLNGGGRQVVSFGVSNTSRSRFAGLEIQNGSEDDVVFENSQGVYPLVTGTLEDHESRVFGGIAITGSTVTASPYGGDVYIVESTDITNDLEIEGSLCIKRCSVYLHSKVDVKGDVFLKVEEFSGTYLYINGGSLSAGGNLDMYSTGYGSYLYMNNGWGGKIHVKGSLTGNPKGVIASSGVLEVEGDIRIDGTFQMSGSNRVVLCGTQLQTVSIPDNGYFATIELQNYSEEGVYSEKVFGRNKLVRNGCKLTYGELQGVFGWTLEQDEVYEGDLVLLDDMLDLNGHKLTVTGDLVQNAGEVKVSGGALEVKGDYRLQSRDKNSDGTYSYGKSNGVLRMTDAEDRVVVEGDFVTMSATDHNRCLTEGTLEVKGDFRVMNAYSESSFVATGNHKVVLNGGGRQEVSFGVSSMSRSRFAGLEIQNGSEDGVVFENSQGVYPLVTGMLEDHESRVFGGIAITGSTVTASPYGGDVYIVENTDITNNLAIEGSLYIKRCSIHLSSQLDIKKNVYFKLEGYTSTSLYVNGGKLLVGGDLEIESYVYGSYLYMNDGRGGTIHIKGSLLGTAKEIRCSNGTLEVEGDIRIDGTFQMSGSNRVVLCGTQLQTVSIPDNGYFATIELQNYSKEGVYSEKVFGRNELIRNGCKLTYVELQGVFGWTLEQDEVYEGDLVLLDDTLDLNGHKLTVTGDLVQNAGEVKVSGGTLEVKGDYRLQSRDKNSDGTYSYGKSNGVLRMTDAEDYVVVEGDFVTMSATDHNRCLTDGTLEVKGDFHVMNAYSESSFVATGNHKVVLNGGGRQEVSFGVSNTSRSRFAGLEIQNDSEDGVVFENSQGVYPLVTGTVEDHESRVSGGIAITGSTVTASPYGGDVYIVESTDITNDLEIEGSLCIKRCSVRLHSKVDVKGDVFLRVEGYASTYLYIIGGGLSTGGNLEIYSTGYGSYLYMNNGGGKIHVKGSLLGAAHAMQCSSGVLEVEGDIRIDGTFQMSGSNRVVLCGTQLQTVSIPDNGYFATIELQNYSKEGIFLKKNFLFAEMIRNGCRISTSDIVWEYGWILQEDEVWDGDFILYDDVMDLNGHSFTVTGDFIQMGGSVKVHDGCLTVKGDYRIQNFDKEEDTVSYRTSSGRLLMLEADDKVVVFGDFVMQPSRTTSGCFVSGILELYGDFIQIGNYGYQAGEDHTVLFAGNKKQEMKLEGAATFGNITNKNTKSLVFHSNAAVTGKILDEGNHIGGAASVSVKSINQIENGSYSGNITIVGDSVMEQEFVTKGTLTINGRVRTQGYDICADNLLINSALQVEGAHITCSGNCNISGQGMLVMTSAKDYVLVNGDVLVDTMCNHKGYLTEGVLEIRGNFTQKGYQNFIATQNHTVILARKRATSGREYVQTVSFQRYAGTTRFNRLVLKKTEQKYHFLNPLKEIANEVVYDIEDMEAPSAVEYILAETVTEGKIKLVFDGAKDNVGILGYEVYRDGKLAGIANNKSYTDTSVSPDTVYTYTVYAFDQDRNKAENSPTLQVRTKADTEAPAVPTGLSMSTRTGSSVTISWLAAKDNVKVAGYTVYCEDAVVAEQVTGTSLKIPDLEKHKIYRYRVAAYDAAGNYSEKSKILETTVAEPQITRILPADNSSIGGTAVDITVYFKNVGNSEGNRVTIEVLNDKDEWEDLCGHALAQKYADSTELYANYKWNIDDLVGEKDYSLRVTLCDADENKDTRTLSYQVDRQAPKIPLQVQAVEDNGTVKLKWEPSSSADCQGYHVFRKPAGEDEYALLCNITGRFENVYTDRNVLEGGTYCYVVTAWDAYCNESGYSEEAEILIGEDAESPEIKTVSPGAGRVAGRIPITVEAVDNKEVAYIGLQYRAESETQWNDIVKKKAIQGELQYQWDTSALEDGVYYLNAYAEDAKGNTSSGEFIRRYEVDNTGIQKMKITVAEAYSSYAKLEWEDVIEEDFAYFQVERKDGDEYVSLGTVKDKLGYYVKGLSPMTEYTFRVVGYDNLGNRGIPSDEVTLWTSRDTTGPYITEVAPVASRYRDILSLAVTAKDDNAIGKAVFSSSVNGTDFDVIATAYAPGESADLRLEYEYDIQAVPEGKLYIKFEVYDKSGNKNQLTKEGKEIIVEYIVDRTAPERVENVRVANDAGYVELTWDAPAQEQTDIRAYRIYRADNATGVYSVIEKECRTLNYYDTSVKIGSVYLYKVSAVDLAGNEGPCSEETIATVAGDTQAPKITGIAPGTGETVCANANLRVLAVDNAGLDRIEVDYQDKSNPGIWTKIASVNAQGTMYLADIIWNNSGLSEGEYSIRAIATDIHGNACEPVVVEYYLDLTKPVLEKASVETGHFETILHMECQDAKDFSHFEIQRRMVSSDNWELISKTAETVYRDTSVEPNTTYIYRIGAYDLCGNFVWSKEMSGYADDVDVVKPQAVLAENFIGLTGMELAFDGTGSMDNVRISEYSWDMGNGDVLHGPQPRYAYQKEGEYTVVLTVTDAAGNSDTTSASVHIYDKTGKGKTTVHVVDERGIGISHALIYLRLGANNHMSLRTDADGYVDLVAEAGVYSVAAYQNEYLPADMDIVFNEYEDKNYTLSLTEDELIVGNLTVRRATLEEMAEAGVDFSNPANLYTYVFKVDLTFERKTHEIMCIVDGEGKVQEKHEGKEFLSGEGWTISIQGIDYKKETKPGVAGGEEYEPILAYISTTQSISWLKDMYNVELGILNAADMQYSIIDSTARLNLPSGVSLAATGKGQSLKKDMGEISGQEKKRVNWIVKGDKRGTYSLSADFSGVLMPFGEKVSAHFEADTEFEVTAGEGIQIIVMPESTAYIGENYYIQFAVINGSDHPLYNFTTSIGAYQEPDHVFTYKNVTTGEIEEEIVPATISDPDSIGTAVVMRKGQMLTFQTLYPGQVFYGTYVTSFSGNEGDDPEMHYYELIEEFVECLSEDNYGVTVSISPIGSHINRAFYEVVETPTYYGDPVDLTTGFFTDSVTALAVRGASVLSYDLNYESGVTDGAGQMGYGWHSDYEMRLENNNGLVRFFMNPSSSMLFIKEEALQSSFYGRKIGDKLCVAEGEEYSYGKYICVSGSMFGCSLTRNNDGTYTMDLPSGGRYEFDASGRPTQICDGEGRMLTLAYADNTITITEAVSGKQLILKQNGEGLVTSVSDQAGRETTFAYDGERNMVSLTLPDQETLCYTYDEKHRILTESNSNGVYVQNVYDEDGRVIS